MGFPGARPDSPGMSSVKGMRVNENMIAHIVTGLFIRAYNLSLRAILDRSSVTNKGDIKH